MHDPFDQRLPLYLSLLSPFPPDVSFVLLLVPPQLSPAAALTRDRGGGGGEPLSWHWILFAKGLDFIIDGALSRRKTPEREKEKREARWGLRGGGNAGIIIAGFLRKARSE